MTLPISVGISPTLKIRGIIATEDLKVGTVIERCPLIFVPVQQSEDLKKTELWKYYFEWTKSYHCISLGYGSLVNHSFSPNVQYIFDYKKNTLNFKVITPIKKGEEVLVNYNGNPYGEDPIPEELIDGNKRFRYTVASGGLHSINLPFHIGPSPTLGIRGLISDTDIKKGQVIERCPVVFFSCTEEQYIDKTVIGKYYFEWNQKKSAMCLGYGALINHSYTPNVYFGRNFKHNVIVFRALHAIRAGEELMINYNGYAEESMADSLDAEYVDFDKRHAPL